MGVFEPRVLHFARALPSTCSTEPLGSHCLPKKTEDKEAVLRRPPAGEAEPGARPGPSRVV
jgi:hypothetical protein